MFTGVEGKTFSPMAITIMLALVAAFILAITLVPALVALMIRGKVAEKAVWAIRKSKERYLPLLDKAIAKPWAFIAGGYVFRSEEHTSGLQSLIRTSYTTSCLT